MKENSISILRNCGNRSRISEFAAELSRSGLTMQRKKSTVNARNVTTFIMIK